MENFRYIEFQQTRDFSEKVTTSLSFASQNFKTLFKSLLFISGPPVLVVSILIGSFVGDFLSLSFQAGRGDDGAMLNYFTSVNLWLQIFLAFVFFVVSIVVTTATLNCYVAIYREKKTNKIEVDEVWLRVRETFWRYLATALLFGFFGVIAYIVLLIPTFVLGAISPFLIFFGFIFIIVGFAYLYISASLVYVIQTFENRGFFDAISRSFYLTRGKWWSTLGTYMILGLLVNVVTSVFMVPAYIIIVVTSLHSVEAGSVQSQDGVMGFIVIVFMTLYYISYLLLTCLPNLGLVFQYFNLVEMKEAKGLLNQIDTFGQTPPPTVEEEHY